MVRGNDLDSVKDSSPETPFAQHVWIFDLGLWMGLVKLVSAFMLQNQRQTKHLYRIDSNTSLYRIILEVFTPKKSQLFFLMLSNVRLLIL